MNEAFILGRFDSLHIGLSPPILSEWFSLESFFEKEEFVEKTFLDTDFRP
jgi:hypothetical protein